MRSPCYLRFLGQYLGAPPRIRSVAHPPRTRKQRPPHARNPAEAPHGDLSKPKSVEQLPQRRARVEAQMVAARLEVRREGPLREREPQQSRAVREPACSASSSPPRAQHPAHLREPRRRIRHVLDRLPRPHHIEARSPPAARDPRARRDADRDLLAAREPGSGAPRRHRSPPRARRPRRAPPRSDPRRSRHPAHGRRRGTCPSRNATRASKSAGEPVGVASHRSS